MTLFIMTNIIINYLESVPKGEVSELLSPLRRHILTVTHQSI